MKAQLSLRQNKIIQVLRNSNTHMTSEEISKLLNVSSKTVRTDIADINDALSSEGICIYSVKGKGFILDPASSSLLKKYTKDHHLFFGQSDRVFYLAVRLCNSRQPINYYDLEDEIAVSSSTLAGDLKEFKRRFVQGVPYIKLRTSKNELMLEEDERKRRFILAKLLSDNWDYNSSKNAYYESDYVDSESFDIINATTAGVLFRHGIHMDDYSLISLNLNLSITYHRILDGFRLNVPVPEKNIIPSITEACSELFAALDEKLDITFPDEEIREVEAIISETRLLSREDFANKLFPDECHDIAARYMERIRDVFGLQMEDDEEFGHRLLSFIGQMYRPMKDLTVRDTPDHIKHHLFVENDVAMLFHRIADEKFDIAESDLLSLTWIISGAFFRFYSEHPGERFKTVVLCHLSNHSMWSLKSALTNQFGGYLDIADVIPIHQKDLYDFSDTELIISTVNKELSGPAGRNVLQISPYLSKDDNYAVINRIRDMKIQRLFPRDPIRLSSLLDRAFVHEKMVFSSRHDLIEFMYRDFSDAGILSRTHLLGILRHESVSSFASDPAILLLYSFTPGTETKLSVLTLDHRIMWNKYKIRIVFMVSLASEDMNELFYLQNTLFHSHFDPDTLKSFKTIDEIKEYYKDW